jgi:type I restriction enzyme S subunit
MGVLSTLSVHNLHYEKHADGTVKCIEDEVPFDLPDGWEWARLSSLPEAIGDGDHQPPPQAPDGVPFLVISNVSDGVISFENTRYVPETYYNVLHVLSLLP